MEIISATPITRVYIIYISYEKRELIDERTNDITYVYVLEVFRNNTSAHDKIV